MLFSKILIYPNQLLRKKAEEIKNPKDPKIQKLAEKMIKIMRKHKGIGLAGPQIGKLLRIIVVETKDGALTFLNPKIIWHSNKEEIDEEGCLSLPKIYGLVKRWQKIKIEAYDLTGKKKEIEAAGLFARVLQHEIDHLDGVLFIDRLIRQTAGPKIK